MNNWNNVKTNPPAEGVPVIVFSKATPTIAYYCDGGFYNLKYDPHLGILRKEYIGTPSYWANYITPAFDAEV
ncbi:MAG: hypothetical protein J6X45_04965 [Lachnospiraceae bacterium]|nr:hypothetical protein [Lachnospiraceae bacterium]